MTENTPAAERWLADANFSRLPTYMHDPVKRYVCDGDYIGDFLGALFEGRRFVDVVGAADDANQAALLGWAQFVYADMPGLAHGTPERVRAWQEAGGINGRERLKAASRG